MAKAKKYMLRLKMGGHSDKHDKLVLPDGKKVDIPLTGANQGDVIETESPRHETEPQKWELAK